MNTRLLKSLAALLAAGALGGCAVGPDYLRPANLLPALFGPAPAEAEVTTATVDARWWQFFNDTTLNELIEQALQKNADLRLAVARVAQADAAAREAGAELYPGINLQAGSSSNKVSSKSATYSPAMPQIRQSRSAGLAVSYELDVWGRVRRSDEAAQAQLLGSRYGRDAVRLSVAGLVANAYLTLRATDAQLAVSQETLATRQQALELVKKRVDAGLGSPVDLHQASGALAAAETQVIELRRQRALGEHQLALLSGNPALRIAPPASADPQLLPLPPLPPAGLPAQLVERRPDVREAEQKLIAANAGIGLAKAGYYPKFTLTGSYGSESKALGDLFAAGAGTWGLGLNLLLPLLDYGRTEARVDQAKAVNEQSLIAWENTLQGAYKDVRDALVNSREQAAAEQAQQVRVDQARETLRLVDLRYRAGHAGYLEVLDAQRTLNDAQLQQITTRQARLAAAVGLFKALGGGWQAEPAERSAPTAN